MTYVNIPYRLGERSAAPLCRFNTIWKVEANHTYHSKQPKGFYCPGLFLTYEGEGRFTQVQSGESYRLTPGTYFLVQEKTPCTYTCQEDDWKFFYVDFSSLDMVHSLRLPIYEVIETGELEEAVLRCEQLIDNLIVQPTGCAYTANILLQELLLLFARERPAPEPFRRRSEIDKALYAMHRNIGAPLDLGELVRNSGMSRTTFFTHFRAMTGLSPNAYMLQLKLESAKASLDTTSLSVKEIAAALHFYDEFHFSKLFKSRYGMSPSAYRRR